MVQAVYRDEEGGHYEKKRKHEVLSQCLFFKGIGGVKVLIFGLFKEKSTSRP
jgi:hypothetical protein